jgi:hypothetical protein
MRKHEISPRVNLSNQELGNPVLVTLVRDTIRCVDLTRLPVCSLVCAGRQYLRFSETLIFIARRNTSLGCPTCLTCMAEVKSQGVLESSCGAFRYRACLICVANVMAVLRPDRHAGVGTGGRYGAGSYKVREDASRYKKPHDGYIVAACAYEVWRNKLITHDEGGVLRRRDVEAKARTNARGTFTCRDHLLAQRFESLVVSAKQLQLDVLTLPRCFRLRARRAANAWLSWKTSRISGDAVIETCR